MLKPVRTEDLKYSHKKAEGRQEEEIRMAAAWMRCQSSVGVNHLWDHFAV